MIKKNYLYAIMIFTVFMGFVFSQGLVPLSIVGGYEGGKMYFYGVKTANPYGNLGNVPNEIVWHTGQATPSYADTWQFNAGRFNLDPYSTNDYWQNLIGVSDGSGKFERDGFGRVRTDSIVFSEEILETSLITKTREIKASIFYADIDITLQTDVDETFGASEKDDPWRATEIIMNVQSLNYDSLPGENGDESNWATLLGVEVKDYEVLAGENAVVMLDFQKGQMLPMFDSWSDFVNGAEASSESGDGFISEVTYNVLDGKQVPIVKNALVSLGFSAFGTEPPNSWSSWREPQLHITIRLHILKVGSWLVTQQVGEEYESPIQDRPEGETIPSFWESFFPDFSGLMENIIMGITMVVLVVVGFIGYRMIRRSE
tara:strand:+ start:368 stop:1486 length:1119 start_codon:yes stop_codon:yes gene_type:complete